MFELKPLSPEGLPEALDKARHYRLLNEPVEAESICLDVLVVDPENQQAFIILLLALTDQFEHRLSEAFREAREVLGRLKDTYEQAYYDGIICERRAKAHVRRGGPGSGHMAYNWFMLAMERFEEAIRLSPPGNPDATLRWNTCARILTRGPELKPEPGGTTVPFLE